MSKFFIDEWHRKAPRFRTVQVAALFGVLNGALLGLAAFMNILDPWWFLGLNVVGYALIAVARITKQPGAEL